MSRCVSDLLNLLKNEGIVYKMFFTYFYYCIHGLKSLFLANHGTVFTEPLNYYVDYYPHIFAINTDLETSD